MRSVASGCCIVLLAFPQAHVQDHTQVSSLLAKL